MKSKLTKEEQDIKHKEYMKKYMKKYYKKNREHLIKINSDNQKNNKDKVNIRNKKNRDKQREKYREYHRNYNAKLRSPESQKRYEEKLKNGSESVGPRSEEWFKKYREGISRRKK